MNVSQGLVIIVLAAVAVIWWDRAATRRAPAATEPASSPRAAGDSLELPSQHARRCDDAWLAQVSAWGDDLAAGAVEQRQDVATSRAAVYAQVSADKTAQLARVGDAA